MDLRPHNNAREVQHAGYPTMHNFTRSSSISMPCHLEGDQNSEPVRMQPDEATPNESWLLEGEAAWARKRKRASVEPGPLGSRKWGRRGRQVRHVSAICMASLMAGSGWANVVAEPHASQASRQDLCLQSVVAYELVRSLQQMILMPYPLTRYRQEARLYSSSQLIRLHSSLTLVSLSSP